MFRLADDGGSISLQWTDKTLDCHHGGVVLVDGYIYGSNWLDNSHGNWCCIDWKSGKPKYEQKWQTKGSIIASDGMLYLYDEKNGNVGLVRPVSEKFDLVSSFKPAEGKGPCWAHPSLDNGILLVRRGEVVMAFDVRGSGR
jgi:outer membrane protein assembly factor BamB